MIPAHIQTEWDKVGNVLRDYTYMFYKVWSMGIPTFTDTIPTAAVGFDKQGNHISFMFNPKFWNKLTQYQRAFVVAHESLHVILEHGIRSVNAVIPRLSNIAMDVVVNHLLCDSYGFERDKLGSLSKDMCWLDTVFPADKIPNVLWGQNYEYYYSMLEQNVQFVDVDINSIDDHTHLPGVPLDKIGGVPKDVAKDITDAKSQDKAPTGGVQAGTGQGGETDVVLTEYKPKRSWYDIFKNLAKVNTKAADENEQWARGHRRVTMLDPRMMIPSEYHADDSNAPEKIEIDLYLDVSGSCWSFHDRFVRAYNTIPKDKFEIRVWQFDMHVSPVPIRKDGSLEIGGGGGTMFDIIEYHIIDRMSKEGAKYPSIVMVFTDGYGNHVRPKTPDNWFWFLGGTNQTKNYIPKGSHIFSLKDVSDVSV